MTEADWLASDDPAAMLDACRMGTLDRGGDKGWQFGHEISGRKLRLFAHSLLWVEGCGPDRDDYPDDPAGWLRCYLSPMESGVARLPGNAAALLRDIVGNPFRPWMGEDAFARGDSAPPTQSLNIVWLSWLTPQVLSLATAAYEERGRVCGTCKGRGQMYYRGGGDAEDDPACFACRGTGRVEDGTLDHVRLAILADALEEAGCPAEEECRHCPTLRKAKVDSSGYLDRDMVQEVIAWGRAKNECQCKGSGRTPHPVLAHLRGSGPHVRGCWAVDLIRPWSLLRKAT